MAGAMRKMAVYLGLVEDEAQFYDEYGSGEYGTDAYGYAADESARPDVRPDPRSEARSATRTLAPVREDKLAAVPARPVAPRVEPDLDSYRITTLHPRTYNDARTVGEYFREGTPVIMNLTDMEDVDAKRLVDFAAGLVFAVHGTIERVTSKVFLLSPANVVVTAEEKARLAEGGFFNQS
jgi:cell division inhibitor SepF